MFTKDNSKNRNKQWDVFNSWEATFQRRRADSDLTDILNWFDAAWKMAREQDPGWINQEIDQKKLLRIQKTRDVFSKLRGLS